MNSCSSIWSVLSTLIIGGAAIYVSILQWRVNQQKLKLDLYDRRVQIYEEVKSLIHKVLKDRNISHSDISDFWMAASQADFLFGPEIPAYIDEIHKHAVDLYQWNSIFSYRNRPGLEHYNPNMVIDGMNREFQRISKQLDPAREKFNVYLSMKA